jgi:transposase-like protein
MLAAALEAEVDAYLAELAGERGEQGRRLVVRNGHAQLREVMTAAGAVQVRAPRLNDKRVEEQTGARKRFRSVTLPPWCRRSPKVAEVLALLCLLVIVGVRAEGTKELVALADGYRESAGSWADLLRDCARRPSTGSTCVERPHQQAAA